MKDEYLNGMSDEELCALVQQLDASLKQSAEKGTKDSSECKSMEETKERIFYILTERCKGPILINLARYKDFLRRNAVQSYEDFMQEAREVVMRAALSYPEDCSATFSRYASGGVSHSLSHKFIEGSGYVRIPSSSYWYGTNRAKVKKDYSYVWKGESIDCRYYDEMDRDASPVENRLAAEGKVHPSAEEVYEELYDYKAALDVMHDIRKSIGERRYDMLIRHEVNGESYTSIGKSYGISRQTARMVVLRAKKKIQIDDEILLIIYKLGIALGWKKNA